MSGKPQALSWHLSSFFLSVVSLEGLAVTFLKMRACGGFQPKLIIFQAESCEAKNAVTSRADTGKSCISTFSVKESNKFLHCICVKLIGIEWNVSVWLRWGKERCGDSFCFQQFDKRCSDFTVCEEFCFFVWLNLFSSQAITYFLLWAHLVLSRDTANPLASVATRPSLLFSISAVCWDKLNVFHVGLDLVLDLKRHCLLLYACLFLPPSPPSCPSLTLFLASGPLLPLAMAYDLIFWCPSSNLYAICHFFPEKSFMSKRCNFSSHDEGQASDLIWNLTSTYSHPEFVSAFGGICNSTCVCLSEGGS